MAVVYGAPESGGQEHQIPASGAALHREPARAQTLSLSTVCLSVCLFGGGGGLLGSSCLVTERLRVHEMLMKVCVCVLL